MPTKTAIPVPETVDEVEVIEEIAVEVVTASEVAIHALIIAPLTTQDARQMPPRPVMAQIHRSPPTMPR